MINIRVECLGRLTVIIFLYMWYFKTALKLCRICHKLRPRLYSQLIMCKYKYLDFFGGGEIFRRLSVKKPKKLCDWQKSELDTFVIVIDTSTSSFGITGVIHSYHRVSFSNWGIKMDIQIISNLWTRLKVLIGKISNNYEQLNYLDSSDRSIRNAVKDNNQLDYLS